MFLHHFLKADFKSQAKQSLSLPPLNTVEEMKRSEVFSVSGAAFPDPKETNQVGSR